MSTEVLQESLKRYSAFGKLEHALHCACLYDETTETLISQHLFRQLPPDGIR